MQLLTLLTEYKLLCIYVHEQFKVAARDGLKIAEATAVWQMNLDSAVLYNISGKSKTGVILTLKTLGCVHLVSEWQANIEATAANQFPEKSPQKSKLPTK